VFKYQIKNSIGIIDLLALPDSCIGPERFARTDADA
jgi:hypothetical protein